MDDTTFDESYIYASLDTAVGLKRMVCWQFARIARTILKESGMETECLVVQRYSDALFTPCYGGGMKKESGTIQIQPCMRKQSQNFTVICRILYSSHPIIQRKVSDLGKINA